MPHELENSFVERMGQYKFDYENSGEKKYLIISCINQLIVNLISVFEIKE